MSASSTKLNIKKVLIADDEELIRKSLARLLAKQGFEVFEAEDGAIASQVWLDKRPDIILLDYLMPKMTGLEVLSQIPENIRGVVIVISAFVGEKERDAFLSKGVRDFYKKPFDDIFKFMEFIKNQYG